MAHAVALHALLVKLPVGGYCVTVSSSTPVCRRNLNFKGSRKRTVGRDFQSHLVAGPDGFRLLSASEFQNAAGFASGFKIGPIMYLGRNAARLTRGETEGPEALFGRADYPDGLRYLNISGFGGLELSDAKSIASEYYNTAVQNHGMRAGRPDSRLTAQPTEPPPSERVPEAVEAAVEAPVEAAVEAAHEQVGEAMAVMSIETL